jgi:hypothetical protein
MRIAGRGQTAGKPKMANPYLGYLTSQRRRRHCEVHCR